MTLRSTFSHLLLFFFLMSKMGPTYPCLLCQQKPSLYCLHINTFLDFQSFGTKGWWWLLYDHTIFRCLSLMFSPLRVRLCLVHVKYFPENMLFSGKENIFKCLVAFQKMLWKIFSSVWLCC